MEKNQIQSTQDKSAVDREKAALWDQGEVCSGWNGKHSGAFILTQAVNKFANGSCVKETISKIKVSKLPFLTSSQSYPCFVVACLDY